MLPLFLLMLAAAFVGYAVFTQYSKTDPSMPVPKRVFASVAAAGGAMAAAVMSWIGQ